MDERDRRDAGVHGSEQREGRGADARSDQYAFAITLYEALFGERPNRERHGGRERSASGSFEARYRAPG